MTRHSHCTKKSKLAATLSLLVIANSGCVDGPLYALKRANPYYQYQWSQDRKLGPTFEERLDELDLLQSQLASMAPTDQERWLQQLEQLVKNDSSSEIRFRAVQVLFDVDSQKAVEVLSMATSDDSEKVRLAACEALGLRDSSDARDLLVTIAKKTSESTSVRQQAVRSLAKFNDDASKQTLGELLADPSPAVQLQVAQSLKELTGRDYGGDFESWKAFLAGQDVPEPEPPSFTAQLGDYVPKLW